MLDTRFNCESLKYHFENVNKNGAICFPMVDNQDIRDQAKTSAKEYVENLLRMIYKREEFIVKSATIKERKSWDSDIHIPHVCEVVFSKYPNINSTPKKGLVPYDYNSYTEEELLFNDEPFFELFCKNIINAIDDNRLQVHLNYGIIDMLTGDAFDVKFHMNTRTDIKVVRSLINETNQYISEQGLLVRLMLDIPKDDSCKTKLYLD